MKVNWLVIAILFFGLVLVNVYSSGLALFIMRVRYMKIEWMSDPTVHSWKGTLLSGGIAHAFLLIC